MISAEPKDNRVAHKEASKLSWLNLAEHTFEIMIYERLSRDLKNARRRNEAIEALEGLDIDKSQLERVYTALGWKQHRKLEIVEIRPEKPLRANPLIGFLSGRLRKEYVQAGERAADDRLNKARDASKTKTAEG